MTCCFPNTGLILGSFPNMFWIQSWWLPIIHRDGIGIWLNGIMYRWWHPMVSWFGFACSSLLPRFTMWKMRTELHVWQRQRHFLESQSGWTKRANVSPQIPLWDSIGKCFQGNSAGCSIAWPLYSNLRCSWLISIFGLKEYFDILCFGVTHSAKLTMG